MEYLVIQLPSLVTILESSYIRKSVACSYIGIKQIQQRLVLSVMSFKVLHSQKVFSVLI